MYTYVYICITSQNYYLTAKTIETCKTDNIENLTKKEEKVTKMSVFFASIFPDNTKTIL